jgi:hypothetical protein
LQGIKEAGLIIYYFLGLKSTSARSDIIITTDDCAKKLTGKIEIVKPGDKIKAKER